MIFSPFPARFSVNMPQTYVRTPLVPPPSYLGHVVSFHTGVTNLLNPPSVYLFSPDTELRSKPGHESLSFPPRAFAQQGVAHFANFRSLYPTIWALYHCTGLTHVREVLKIYPPFLWDRPPLSPPFALPTSSWGLGLNQIP